MQRQPPAESGLMSFQTSSGLLSSQTPCFISLSKSVLQI